MSRSADLAALIRARAGDAPPEVGLVLGSGLGHLAGTVEGVAIAYADLPGFPHAGVSGHNPQLVIGQLEGRRVAVFGGRAHYYESGRADAMRLPFADASFDVVTMSFGLRNVADPDAALREFLRVTRPGGRLVV